MTLFPKRVDLDEASISQLAQLYQAAAGDLRSIVLTVAGHAVTIVSVRQARALIRHRIAQLSQDVNGWSGRHVQGAYDTGSTDVVGELRSFNDRRTDLLAAAIVAGSVALDQLHHQAVTAIADDAQTRLSEATAQMERSADKTLGQLLRSAVRTRVAERSPSSTTAPSKKTALQILTDNGIYALTDKSGKRWQPDVYAEMVARNSLTTARNTALSNALAFFGYDLVKVSAHGAIDACRDWEDTILSLNGDTPNYFTVADATAGGLFHVNCQHSLSPADPADYPARYFPPIDGQ